MITQMTVERFKAIKSITVDLEPFTVLIGPNDTGKSSFLEAIYALTESTHQDLANCFCSPWESVELVYNGTTDSSPTFLATLSANPVTGELPDNRTAQSYELSFCFKPNRNCLVQQERVNGEPIGPKLVAPRSGESFGPKKHITTLGYFGRSDTLPPVPWNEKLALLLRSIPRATTARWDFENLARPSSLPADRGFALDPSGFGLTTCVAEMRLTDVKSFVSVLEQFQKLFPEIIDLQSRRVKAPTLQRDQAGRLIVSGQGEGYALTFIRENGIEIPAGLASGGSLVALALLTLSHLPQSRRLLLIEEPENGLHPALLKEVVGALKKVTTAHPGSQVVLTTHSPFLLDYVEPREVRIFSRDDNGDVAVYNAGQIPDIQERLRHLLLGELVYNEGEQELIREIRESEDSRARGGTH